jgi:(p)ppGpp synthase/HD superfamily hydrolase
MANRTATPRLTQKFVDALTYAADKHASQTRKASGVPYLGHLLSVAGLVIEDDGTETQAIAALLHDAPEDQGGAATLAEIGRKFGADVASIVEQCSDTLETPKPPWRPRKESYIHHLGEASNDAVLVSLADKLDNARAILRDFRLHGDAVWQRFSVRDPQSHLWYYRSLLEVFGRRSNSWMVGELRRVVDELEQAIDRQRAQEGGGWSTGGGGDQHRHRGDERPC